MANTSGSPKDILKAAPLFAALDEAELISLPARSGIRAYSPCRILFSEGEPCTGLFIVVTGRVRIFKTSPSGREHVLAVEGPGASVAELPVFDGGSYPTSASALEETTALFVSRRIFARFAWNTPKFPSSFYRWWARGCAGWSASSKSCRSQRSGTV